MNKRDGTKRVTAEEAIGNVKSGQRIVIPLGSGLPLTLIEALVADHGRLRDVELVSGIQMTYPYLEDGFEESFSFRTWQCTPAIRHLIQKGTVKFIPMRQGDAVKVFSKRGPWPVHVALIQVSPPDQHGFCSLGVSIGHTLPLALESDLVIAETIKGRQFSAIGGSFDFVQGALFSEEGCSIIAMASATPDEKISRIIPQLAVGSAVTTPRHSAQYIVTEYGVAEIWGRSTKERAEALIHIAHPKFRDELGEEAKKIF